MDLQDKSDSLNDVTARLSKMWPKQTQDQLATALVLFGIPFAFLVECGVVLPQWYAVGSDGYNWRVFWLLAFGLTFYANFYKLVTVNPNGPNADLPSVMRPGFKYCHTCQLNAPPRSHHCPVCEKCIFKRDHHCSFGAVCVGHFNHRYFIAGALHIWLCVALVLSWNWWFMWENLGGMRPTNLWMVFMPHLAFMFRFVTLWQFTCTAIFVSSTTVFLFCSYLLGAQIFCIYLGQTRVEFLLNVRAFNIGAWANWKQVMGRRWFLTLLSPFFNSPLDCDGISFPVKEGASIHDSTKSM
uniref:Palmitoyltransferase n=1 Tax=Plectus sambesii TaxID=2011161 RepID=A0A914VHG1_9BILA